MIIGLVSLFIGSIDLSEIEAFCAAASERGARVLEGTFQDEAEKTIVPKKTKGF